MLSNGSAGKQEGPLLSTSCTSPSAAIKQSIKLPPGTEAIVVDKDEVVGISDTTPQVFGTAKVTLGRDPVPQPLVDKPSFTAPPPPGSNPGLSVPLQMFEPPQFVSPQEIFAPPQSVKLVKNHPDIVPPMPVDSLIVTPPIIKPSQTLVPMVHEPSLAVPSPVLEKSQMIPPVQALLVPAVHEPHSLVVSSPNLESSQAVVPHCAVSPVVTVSPLVTSSPDLGSSQLSPPTHPVVSPMVTAWPSLVTPLSLGSSQAVITHHVFPPTVTEPPLVTPLVGSSLQAVAPKQVGASQKLISQHQMTDPSPHVIRNPQATAVHPSPDLAEGIIGGNLKATPTTASNYKSRGATITTQPRRESIEGAPDIILSLGGLGYELATPSLQ